MRDRVKFPATNLGQPIVGFVGDVSCEAKVSNYGGNFPGSPLD